MLFLQNEHSTKDRGRHEQQIYPQAGVPAAYGLPVHHLDPRGRGRPAGARDTGRARLCVGVARSRDRSRANARPRHGDAASRRCLARPPRSLRSNASRPAPRRAAARRRRTRRTCSGPRDRARTAKHDRGHPGRRRAPRHAFRDAHAVGIRRHSSCGGLRRRTLSRLRGAAQARRPLAHRSDRSDPPSWRRCGCRRRPPARPLPRSFSRCPPGPRQHSPWHPAASQSLVPGASLCARCPRPAPAPRATAPDRAFGATHPASRAAPGSPGGGARYGRDPQPAIAHHRTPPRRLSRPAAGRTHDRAFSDAGCDRNPAASSSDC